MNTEPSGDLSGGPVRVSTSQPGDGEGGAGRGVARRGGALLPAWLTLATAVLWFVFATAGVLSVVWSGWSPLRGAMLGVGLLLGSVNLTLWLLQRRRDHSQRA